MGNENCPVLLWIDNMTIVHWEWMTAVALELSEQHRMNECYKFFQNGAPISQEFVSTQNKYMPVFHYLSKFSISWQTPVLPAASKCQWHVPA